jgi:opacity protein-like surface antigen
MQKFTFGVLTASLLAVACNGSANPTNNSFYLKGFMGAAFGKIQQLTLADGKYSHTPTYFNTHDKSALYGFTLGYTNLGLQLPINLELQAIHSNQQAFKMDALYPTEDNYHDVDTLNISSNAVLLNILYAWPLTERYKTFLGAGAGLSFNKTSGNFISDTDLGYSGFWPAKTRSNFAYDFTAGLSYQLNAKIELSIAYQYLDLGKAATRSVVLTTNGPQEPSNFFAKRYSNNNIIFAITYRL